MAQIIFSKTCKTQSPGRFQRLVRVVAKRAACLLLFTGMLQTATSQEAPGRISLTLEKAKALSKINNPALMAKDVDVLAAQEAVREARLKKMPEVFADFNLQKNLIIPTTPVPARAFDPRAPEDKILPLKFTTRHSGNTGFNASYDIFNPVKNSQIEEEKLKAAIILLDKKILAADAEFNTANAYASAIIAQEQLKLALADTLSKSRILQMLQEQFKEGRITLIQLNDGKKELNNAISRLKEAQNIVLKANSELLYYIGYDPEADIQLYYEDDINILSGVNYDNHRIDSSLEALKTREQNKLLAAQINTVRAGLYPTVSLTGYLGSNYFDNNFDIWKSANWYGNSYINLGVKMPILGWNKSQTQMRSLNLQIKSNELQLEDLMRKNRLDYVKARRDADFSSQQYQQLYNNFLLQQKNLELVQQQYSEGRALISDVAQSDFEYQQAKYDYLKAAYNYIISKNKMESQLKK